MRPGDSPAEACFAPYQSVYLVSIGQGVHGSHRFFFLLFLFNHFCLFFFGLVSFSPPHHTHKTYMQIPAFSIASPTLAISASKIRAFPFFRTPCHTHRPTQTDNVYTYVRMYACVCESEPHAPIQLKRNGAKYIKSASQPTDGPSELIQLTKQAGPGR